MKQYSDLVHHALTHGVRKENRTGVDTLSTFGYYYEHDLRDGFPLLTTKAVSWKNIVVELLWFLSGSDKAEFLERHKCYFWKPWYLDDGRVANCYGPAWRKFPVHAKAPVPQYVHRGTNDGYDAFCEVWFGDNRLPGCGPVGTKDDFPVTPDATLLEGQEWCPKCIQAWSECHPATPFPKGKTLENTRYVVESNDQVAWVIKELKRNPMSRRMIVNAWAPGIAQTAPLPPCHAMWALNVQNSHAYGVQGAVNQRLCLHLTQRSCDIALGVPYNLASYALLLSLMSRFSGIEPGIFGHTLIDAHVYTSKPDGSMAEYDHVPGLTEQISREPRNLPRLVIDDSIKSLEDVEALLDPSVSTADIMAKFILEGYDPHPEIKFKVAV